MEYVFNIIDGLFKIYKFKNTFLKSVFINDTFYEESQKMYFSWNFGHVFRERRLHGLLWWFWHHWTGCSPFELSRVSWWPIGWTVGTETINLRRVYSSMSSQMREIVLEPWYGDWVFIVFSIIWSTLLLN